MLKNLTLKYVAVYKLRKPEGYYGNWAKGFYSSIFMNSMFKP
jgi:hypothetical protein